MPDGTAPTRHPSALPVSLLLPPSSRFEALQHDLVELRLVPLPLSPPSPACPGSQSALKNDPMPPGFSGVSCTHRYVSHPLALAGSSTGGGSVLSAHATGRGAKARAAAARIVIGRCSPSKCRQGKPLLRPSSPDARGRSCPARSSGTSRAAHRSLKGGGSPSCATTGVGVGPFFYQLNIRHFWACSSFSPTLFSPCATGTQRTIRTVFTAYRDSSPGAICRAHTEWIGSVLDARGASRPEADTAMLLSVDALWQTADTLFQKIYDASTLPRNTPSSASSARPGSIAWRRSRPTSTSPTRAQRIAVVGMRGWSINRHRESPSPYRRC